MASKPYNGHPSWNAWNVALWIGNDEGLYNLALDCIKRAKAVAAKRRLSSLTYPYTLGALLFQREVGAERTPDGARYSHRSVKLALEGLDE